MPKSKGKRGKGKNKSYNSWRSDMPEETPFLDSSLSSEEDEPCEKYYSLDNQNKPEPTNDKDNEPEQPRSPTPNGNYAPDDDQDGQDWPDDISDSHLALIQETTEGILEFQEQTLEQKIQDLLHTRVKIIAIVPNPIIGNTIIGKLAEVGSDQQGEFIILRSVDFGGDKVSFRIRTKNIDQIDGIESLGALTQDDDTMSVKSFQQRAESAASSASSSAKSSKRVTPEADDQPDQRMSGSEEHSRPETALSGVLNMEKDEDLDHFEELLKTNQEQPESSNDTDNDEQIDEEEDTQQAKTFITTIKNKLRGKLQEGEIAISDMMESILTTCEQMGIRITKEKIKKMFIPHTMDFKRSRDLAAIYRLIVLKTTSTPRRRWNFLTKHAFEDEALFEEAKLRWICSCKARVNQHLEELRRERNFQGKILNTKEAVEQIWNANILTAILKKSAKEHNIRFSEAQIQWTLNEMKPPVRDSISALQNLAWWEQVWTKLATHPMSKIPLTWNGFMRDIYPRDTYPNRGYLRLPHKKTSDELTIASSSDHETDTKKSPPPDAETVRIAKNRIVENLAINGAIAKVSPDEINKELDWLAKSHANAKTFYDKLDDLSR